MEKKEKKIDEEEEKIEYLSRSFRLHEQTYESLKELRKESGLSWNLFFYNNLIKKDGDKRRK